MNEMKEMIGLCIYLTLVVGCLALVARWFDRRSRFERYVHQVRTEGDELVEKFKARVDAEIERSKLSNRAGAQRSTLTFRDLNGNLSSVDIVIDPAMEGIMTAAEEERDALTKAGMAPISVEEMASGNVPTGDLSQTREFVFPPSIVQAMREAGLEPDEVVTNMLKAAGRMR